MISQGLHGDCSKNHLRSGFVQVGTFGPEDVEVEDCLGRRAEAETDEAARPRKRML